MKKIFKVLSLSFLALALIVGVGAGSANATLTLDATSITTNGAFTVTSVAGSTVNMFAANTTGAINIGGTSQTSGATTIYGGTGTGAITFTPGVGGTIVMGNTAGTGAITLGSSSGASQIVNIGTGSGATQTVNIMTGVGANTLNLGTGGTGVQTIHIGDNATPVNVITIGGAASTTTVGGDFNLTVAATVGATVTATANTSTAGVLDLDITAGDAAVDGLNISLTQNDGATAARDAVAAEILLTGNDADGDMFGLTITGASTANSAAGTYEAGIFIDNADTTAASMTDGILITSSGVAAGVTDALDVSAANITNAINIGANNVLSTGTVTFSRADAGVVTLAPADDTGAADITLDALLTGAIIIGSADVTSITITADGTADGTDLVLPPQGVNGSEILNNTVTETQLAATVTLADGDVLDLSSTVTTTAAAKGLKLPQKTDCSLGVTEGFACWDTDNNVLYIGDGATASSVAGSTAGVNTWTDNQIFTFVGDEDIAIGSTAATITTGVLGLTVAAGDAAVDGLNISLTQNDGATAARDAVAAEILLTGNDADGDMFGLTITGASTANSAAGTYEAGIFIDNADTTAASMTDGIIITSSGVNEGVTDAIDVSATNILNAINIGANPIVTGNVAGTIGDATTDSLTFTTDGTGTGEIVLPLTSIGSPELTAGAKTNTIIVPVPDPGGANSDITAGYVLWTPSVNVTITKVYTIAETAWVAAAAANDASVVVTNAAVGTVSTLAVVTALAVGSSTDTGAITNGDVVAGTNVTIAVTTNGTADAPRQNIQIEYTTTD